VEATHQEREQPVIKAAQGAAIQAMVDAQGDATLDTYCQVWEQHSGSVIQR